MKEGLSNTGDEAHPLIPPALTSALEAWRTRGHSFALIRWLDRELDAEGMPRRLVGSAWGPCLDMIAAAWAARPGEWPEECDARVEGLLRAAFRFHRPDGSAIFAGSGPDPARLASLRAWAERLSDPTLVAVAHRWAPPRGRRAEAPGPPPLPAHASPDMPIAILRPDWTPRGDWLAIDHRRRGGPALLELAGGGRPWLGPWWSAGTVEGRDGPARLTHWQTGPMADLAEWSFGTPAGRVVRTALLLRGRGLAVLADQVQGDEPLPAMRVGIAGGVGAAPAREGQSLVLSAGRGRSARVLPIGLPQESSPAEGGSLTIDGGSIVLRQRSEGRRCWLPLLVSWLPDRDRRPTRWRALTVSERSRACPPGVAFAARVAWGAGDGLVVYRSLARPALRTFLGHQTRARFLVGLFTSEGDVRPLVKIDE